MEENSQKNGVSILSPLLPCHNTTRAQNQSPRTTTTITPTTASRSLIQQYLLSTCCVLALSYAIRIQTQTKVKPCLQETHSLYLEKQTINMVGYKCVKPLTHLYGQSSTGAGLSPAASPHYSFWQCWHSCYFLKVPSLFLPHALCTSILSSWHSLLPDLHGVHVLTLLTSLCHVTSLQRSFLSALPNSQPCSCLSL